MSDNEQDSRDVVIRDDPEYNSDRDEPQGQEQEAVIIDDTLLDNQNSRRVSPDRKRHRHRDDQSRRGRSPARRDHRRSRSRSPYRSTRRRPVNTRYNNQRQRNRKPSLFARIDGLEERLTDIRNILGAIYDYTANTNGVVAMGQRNRYFGKHNEGNVFNGMLTQTKEMY